MARIKGADDDAQKKEKGPEAGQGLLRQQIQAF